MKCLKFITIALLTINIAACGDSSAPSCKGTPLSDKAVTYGTSFGTVTTNIRSDCTYSVPACNEVGIWEPTGNGSASFTPKSTSCGSLKTVDCTYTASGSLIAFTCH